MTKMLTRIVLNDRRQLQRPLRPQPREVTRVAWCAWVLCRGLRTSQPPLEAAAGQKWPLGTNDAGGVDEDGRGQRRRRLQPLQRQRMRGQKRRRRLWCWPLNWMSSTLA